MSVAPDAPSAYTTQIASDEAAVERYRSERSERAGRGASTRTSDRLIGRLEAEMALLREWADRDGRASAR